MATQYPNGIDNTGSLPYVTNGVSPMVGEDVNRLRDAIVAVETELGANPSGTFTSVDARLGAAETAISDYANSTFLVLSANGFISQERVFAPSVNFAVVDGGAGANYEIDLAANIGIGTLTPASDYSLTLDGDGAARIGGVTLRNAGTDTFYIGSATASDSANISLMNPNAGYVAMGTDGTERVRITSAGNVGIGTSAPGSALTIGVDGTAALPVLTFGSVADSDTGIWHPAADMLAFSANAIEVLRLESAAITLFATTNYSGASNIVFDNTVGHTISVENSVDSSGKSLTIYGGNAPVSATASSQSGGSVSLYAGDGANGIDPSIGGTGGFVQLLSGDGGDGWGAVAGQNAGGFNVIGGSGGSGGVSAAGGLGGHMQMTLGNGGVAGTTSGNGGSGGAFTLQTGAGGNASPAGGTGVGGSGGTITLSTGQGGSASGTGNAGASGSVVLAPAAGRPAIGSRLGGAAGGITFTPGSGGAGGTTAPGVNAGTFVVTAATGGAAGTVSGNGGSGSSLTLNGGQGGPANTGTGTGGAGGFVTLRGGQGGTASSTAAGGAGGPVAIVGGVGGSASAASGVPGAGGLTSIRGGAGGQGGPGHAAAAGGNVDIRGGSAGFDIGTGFNNGGNVIITGGGPSPFSAGLYGNVDIGGTFTNSVSIGSASITTTILGTTGVTTLRGAAGGSSAPTFSFTADTDTGIYSIGADQLGIATNGTLRASVSDGEVAATVPFRGAGGTAAAPTFSFAGDTDTGIYNSAANQIGFAASGIKSAHISSTEVAASVPFRGAAGSDSAPTFSFAADADTGVYSPGANQLALIAGGKVSQISDEYGLVETLRSVSVAPLIGKTFTKQDINATTLTSNFGAAATEEGTASSPGSGTRAVTYTTSGIAFSYSGIYDANYRTQSLFDPIFSVVFSFSDLPANLIFAAGFGTSNRVTDTAPGTRAIIRYNPGAGDTAFKVMINRSSLFTSDASVETVSIIPQINTIYRFMIRFIEGGSRMQAWLATGHNPAQLIADTSSGSLPAPGTVIYSQCTAQQGSGGAVSVNIQSMSTLHS